MFWFFHGMLILIINFDARVWRELHGNSFGNSLN